MWTDKYLGLAYDIKTNNCAHFVERVIRDEFNKNIDLPKGGDSLFSQTRTINENRDKFLKESLSFKDGHMILMKGKRNLLHLGVAVLIGGVKYCLHCTSLGKLSRLDDFKRLKVMGFEIVGVYEWL